MKRTTIANLSGSQVDWVALRREAHDLAERVAPLLPARSPRRDAVRRAKSLATFARNVTENRRRLRRGDEAIRPLFYIWTMLNACNFVCSYCDDHRGHKYPEMPNRGSLNTEQGHELLRIMRTGTSAIYFCGGEPTLRPDLPELTAEAERLGYWPVMINTNGSRFHHLLTQPRWAEWLSRMDVVIISLDSLDLDRLAEMYRYPRPHEVIVNILALSELAPRAGFKLYVNTVIQPDRVSDARDVLAFCKEIGAWFTCAPLNSGARLHADLNDNAEYVDLARHIIERARAGARIVGGPRLLERLLFGGQTHCLPTAFAHVLPDGTLSWPCKPAINVEPVHVRVLGREHLDAAWAMGRSLIDPNNFHGSGPAQCGGECNWMQHYVSDSFVRLLTDPWGQKWVAGSLWRFLARGR